MENVVICWMDESGNIRQIKRFCTEDLAAAAVIWTSLSDQMDELCPDTRPSDC